MLKRSELDQIDSFLMGATLQDVIKIVHVCQTLTAECRLMLDVIDRRTEEFFSENFTNTKGKDGDPEALHLGTLDAVATPAALPPTEKASDPRSDRTSDEIAKATAANEGRDSQAEKGDSKKLGERQSLFQEVGGEVLAEERDQQARPKVKRRRGRPRKNREADSASPNS